MSTPQPGYEFSNQVPPMSAFFSKITNGMPACSSWIAAQIPAKPAPITTTLNPLGGCRASPPAAVMRECLSLSPISSSSSGTYAEGTVWPTATLIIWRRMSSSGGVRLRLTPVWLFNVSTSRSLIFSFSCSGISS